MRMRAVCDRCMREQNNRVRVWAYISCSNN